MVEGGQLVEIGIASLGIATVKALGELQHVVRVAAFGTIDVVDEVHTGVLAGEMFATAVTAKGKRTLTSHDVPEEGAGVVVDFVACQFGDTLESYHLRHLRVGMHVVEAVLALRHRGEQSAMREAACHVEILRVTCDGIGIGQYFVHTTVLVAQHSFHLLVAEAGGQVDCPVAEAEEKIFRLLVAAVQPGIAQSGIHLVQVIERCPGTEVNIEVALFEGAPDAFAVRHAAHVAASPFGVVTGVGIGTFLQFSNHIFHALAALFVARGCIQGHGGQVMAAHVSVESVPVRIGWGLGCQTCLLAVGGKQAVAVILQQGLDVQVAGVLQRTIENRYIAERKLVGIQLVLCLGRKGESQQRGKNQGSFHLYNLNGIRIIEYLFLKFSKELVR